MSNQWTSTAWTREAIEHHLRMYRERRCHAEQLRLDIAGWKDAIKARDEAIAAAALRTPPEPDMPRSGTTSDPTSRIAMRLPDEVELSRMRIQLRMLQRDVRRVESWLEALPNRERILISMVHVDGMVWSEAVTTYNSKPPDGIAREERTLRRWKHQGIDSIVKLANY